jgi:hypothetical protein
MKNHFNAPLKSSTHNEDTYRKTQLKTIFLFLYKNVATASMVANATGVPQKNITRFKRDLEKVGRLWELKKDYCTITGFKAWYLSTNPKFKSSTYNQLSLFNDFEGGVND